MSSYILHIHRESIDIQQWNKLLDTSSFASYFQSPSCYDFYASLSFMKPFVFAVEEAEELKALVCGYLVAEGGRIKQFFSRRAIILGGVLLANDTSDKLVKLLLQAVIQHLNRKTIYVEMRNFFDYSAYKTVFEENGFSYQPHLNFQIKGNSIEEIFKKFSKSKQRQIRQAEKQGVNWEFTTQKCEVEAFYMLLSDLYKKRIRRPLFSIEFFYKFVELNEAKLIVVKHQNRIIGGMATIALPNGNFYEWFVCGDDRANKNLYPSVMATWAGIHTFINNQYKLFDFMGAGKPNANYGVRTFKSKFGGEEVEFGRFLYIGNKILYNFGVFVIHLLSKKEKHG